MIQKKKALKRRGKTKKILLRQTKEQNRKNSLKIDEFMTKDLKNLIDYNFMKYKNCFDTKLGMSESDIKSDIMFQIWKGIATHDKTKKANLKTYVSTLITNRFKLLAKKSSAKKYSIISYIDFLGQECARYEDNEEHENSESLFEKREDMLLNIKEFLNDFERAILNDLFLGLNLDTMVKKHRCALVEVIQAIKKIESLNSRKDEEITNG